MPQIKEHICLHKIPFNNRISSNYVGKKMFYQCFLIRIELDLNQIELRLLAETREFRQDPEEYIDNSDPGLKF